MKTLRYKRDSHEHGVQLLSTPVIDHPDSVAYFINMKNAMLGRVAYSVLDDLTYFAIRAARLWLLSEPGDEAADKTFKVALVNAGLVPDTSDILGIVCTGEDDYRVQVVTEKEIHTLDTNAATLSSAPMPEGVAA